jgi:hypothetical protein
LLAAVSVDELIARWPSGWSIKSMGRSTKQAGND